MAHWKRSRIRLAVSEKVATALADIGRVSDDVIGVLNLSQSRAHMTELAANTQARLLSQASCTLDLLPWQVERRRQVGVMRVTLDSGRTSFDLAFEFV
ncbi:MAG: hypothetical protein WCF57_15930 [Pyrinomonadaceae bacterium]